MYPDPLTPSIYGRACSNCAGAKSKCVYASNDGGCERCRRLSKQCVPSASVRKRGNRRTGSSRTAQLEEKLEDLVTMLRDQSSGKFAPNSIPTPSPGGASANGFHAGSDNPSPREAAGHGARAPQTPNSHVSGAMDGTFCDSRLASAPVAPISSMIPLPNTPAGRLEAEASIRSFRTRYLDTFPCVYLPRSMTAEGLREEKPLLWFAITMVTCQSSSRQLAMGDTMQKIVAQKLVVEHEKSMDILLALLVFLGWSQYNRRDKPYLATFCHLAISLIFDLALTRPVGESSTIMCFKSLNQAKLAPPAARTMEGRRAVLACFYLTSQISYTMKKMDGLTWTPYMDECLNELSRQPESPQDEILVSQVRLQLIVEQLHRAPWQCYEPRTAGTAGPPASYLHALQSRLKKVKSELPPELASRVFMQLQLHYTKLVTLESGLSRNASPPSSNPDFRRYDMTSKCLEATKDWFDTFFSMPSSDLHAMPFLLWSQLAHCVVTLYRLTTLDEPAWDRAQVRDTLDLLVVCDRIIADFNAVRTKHRLPANDSEDIFFKGARMLQSMKSSWAAELAKTERPAPADAAAAAAAAATTAATAAVQGDFVDSVTTGPMAVPMMMLDESWMVDNIWLTDIFNASWE